MKSITELKEINQKPKLKDFDKLPFEVRKKAIEDLERDYELWKEKVKRWKIENNANQ